MWIGSQARWPPSRNAALVVAAAAVGVVAAAVLMTRSGYEPGGPIASARETSVTTHARPGTPMTWGTVLPENPTAVDIVIESIQPSAPASGLTILGIGVSDPRRGAVGTAASYPPPGITPLDVAGAVMTPRTGSSPFLQVVVGIRLDDSREGRIAGLRIRYLTGGRRFETVLHDALVVLPPETSSRHGIRG
ncbi:MAG TPA: hypothetical protein VGQ02_00975 [Candidatus Limnocylindrales bacterium]|jgi:hypothetical protein|nr:hypothetical protein [Candidatus Limnocylindrales bacterium]